MDTDANGNEIQFLYDALYRLTEIQYEESTVSLIYDLNSNRIRMDDNSPNPNDYVEYQYDHWNRLITETRHVLTNTYMISYHYDEVGRLTNLTYPDNTQILYSYNDLNLTTEIRRYVDGVQDEILLNNTQYNNENQLLGFNYGNGLHTTFAYDTRDRLSALDVSSGDIPYLSLDYTYDSNCNITQLVNGWRNTDSEWNSDTEIYGYDGLDRITSASCASWSHTYSYDKVGNRITEDSTTYTVNTANEIIALSDGTSLTYDLNGNRTGKTQGNDTWVYTYDCGNRLTKVEKNSTLLAEYTYDGDGRRIQTTENGETTTHIYSGLTILYEENATGSALYIYGPTGRLAKRTLMEGESSTFYYHTDHQGSTRLVTDESRTIVAAVMYEPFGKNSVTGEESSLYSGKEMDSTGLYCFGARYYDPQLGTFITRDPIAGKKALPQSLNRYAYCLNNPVRLTDPTGMSTFRMCDVNTGRCIRIRETGNRYWTAYDADGNKITDSREIEGLIASEDPKDQARAAYLMLLVTHPEIEGDPSQEPLDIEFDTGSEYTTWFSFEVTIDGEPVIIHIGIDSRMQKEIPGSEPYYGESDLVYLGGDESVVKEAYMVLYQKAFSSVATLYHIVGHEGQHVVDLIRVGSTNEASAFKWNKNNDFAPPYYIPFPFDWRRFEHLLPKD